MGDIYEPNPPMSRLGDGADHELLDCEKEILTTTKDMSLLRSECHANVSRLRDSYRPKVYPYVHAIHMNQFYLSSMRVEVEWLERKAKAMTEAPHGSFFEQRDMAQAKRDLFAPMTAAFQLAFKDMSEVPKKELALLRGYENPPPLVWDTVRTVMQVRGDDDIVWGGASDQPHATASGSSSGGGDEDELPRGAKVILSDTYYYAFFASRCKQQIRSEILTEDGGVLLAALEKYLLNPESTPERVAAVSPPCAPMARFLSTLYLFAKCTEITQATNCPTLQAVRNRLSEQRLKIQEREEDIRGAEQKVNALREELKQREKELAERYDVTMVPLQDLFFQAHDHFVQTVHQKSPTRQRAP